MLSSFQHQQQLRSYRGEVRDTTSAKQIYGVDVDSKSIFRYNIKDMITYINENKHRAKKTKYEDVVMWVPVTSDIIEKLQ